MGRLKGYVYVDGTLYGPDSDIPEDVALQVTNPKAWEDEVAGDYASLKVADLKAEIESRNEGRKEADLIPSDGNKADLIAALEADDES